MTDPTLSGKTCSRCQNNPATVQSRANILCDSCYMRYVSGKVAKAMSRFRVRGNDPPRTFLLALSFGPSSLSLLHILASMLKSSIEKIGRYGYCLHVLFVDDASVFDDPEESKADDPVQQLWRIADIFKHTDYPMIASFAWRSTQAYFDNLDKTSNDLSDLFEHLELNRPPQSAENDSVASTSSASPYHTYIASLASTSARTDANAIITRRVIVEYAKKHGCEAVLWGDTTTRLAERTLAEAAKGRGFSMPWQTGDGPTPYGVDFIFPMRELLRKEVLIYAGLVDPPLTQVARQEKLVGSPQVSSKDASIDALMMQYFQSVEENFPSIVTNVVRTSSKLKPGALPSDARCQLCALPVPRDAHGLHNWAGSQEGEQPHANQFLCYGCARTMQGRKSLR